jgi:hypothetical protein
MVIAKSYGGASVAFEPSILNENVMVNATQMGKIFNKLPKDFLKNDETKAFIQECLKKENSPYLSIKKESDLVISRQKSGTWMHRILALKFAAWLNPAFELWVYTQIEELLFGFSRDHDLSIKRTILLQHELRELENKPDKNGADMERYIMLQTKIITERSIRAIATKSRFREVYRCLKPSFETN